MQHEKPLAIRQEETLRERAFAERAFLPLIHFHAARRDTAALQALLHEPVSPVERMACQLMLGEVPADPMAALNKQPDAWLAHALTKALLRQTRVSDAAALAAWALEQAQPEVTPVNLLAKFCAKHGEPGLARQFAEISLLADPYQDDLTGWHDGDLAEAVSSPLYLDPLPAPLAMTAYLPAYNVAHYLPAAIEAWLGQSHPLAELLIIDDGSTDEGMDLARRYPVHIISHATNQGLAAGRNTAFAHAQTDWVAAADADVCPAPDFLQYAVMELENASAAVAGVGGRLIERYAETPADLFRRLHLNQDPGLVRHYGREFLFGADTVLNRQAVQQAGGYDLACRTNGEDSRMGEQLRATGYVQVFSPLLRAEHQRRDTPASVLRTLWGWSFLAKERQGHLSSLEHVLAVALENLKESQRLIRLDREAGHTGAVYVDLLFAFHDTFHNLRYAADHGMIAPPHALWISREMLETLREWDEAVFARAWADSQTLLNEGAKSIPVPVPTRVWMETMRAALQRFFKDVLAPVRHHLA